jgi:hypothetical protein
VQYCILCRFLSPEVIERRSAKTAPNQTFGRRVPNPSPRFDHRPKKPPPPPHLTTPAPKTSPYLDERVLKAAIHPPRSYRHGTGLELLHAGRGDQGTVSPCLTGCNPRRAPDCCMLLLYTGRYVSPCTEHCTTGMNRIPALLASLCISAFKLDRLG